jgi:hypothetical protein
MPSGKTATNGIKLAAGARRRLPTRPTAVIAPKYSEKRRATGVRGSFRPFIISPTRNFIGCLIINAPAVSNTRNGAARDGASKTPARSGSNKNPHAPCSTGSAIDFAGILDLIGKVETFADIYITSDLVRTAVPEEVLTVSSVPALATPLNYFR